jgi:hypothetical protein
MVVEDNVVNETVTPARELFSRKIYLLSHMAVGRIREYMPSDASELAQKLLLHKTRANDAIGADPAMLDDALDHVFITDKLGEGENVESLAQLKAIEDRYLGDKEQLLNALLEHIKAVRRLNERNRDDGVKTHGIEVANIFLQKLRKTKVE